MNVSTDIDHCHFCGRTDADYPLLVSRNAAISASCVVLAKQVLAYHIRSLKMTELTEGEE